MNGFKYKQSRLLKKFLDRLTEEWKKSNDPITKALGMTFFPMKGDFVKQMEKSERMREDFDHFIESIRIEIEAYQDWIIKIPAKLKGSSSIQRMANDLIEKIKVEGKRLDEGKIE